MERKLFGSRPILYNPRPAVLLFFAVCWGVLFILTWLSVAHHGFITGANQSFFFFTQSHRSPAIDNLWILLTLLGSPKGLLGSTVLVVLVLAWQKQWRPAIHLLLLTLVSVLAIKMAKYGYLSPRPAGFFQVDPTSSFPSGHTVMSVTVLGFLAFLTGQIFVHSRRFCYGSFLILIVLISLSRLFLGQHWLSDIAGAWFLGLCLLSLACWSYQQRPIFTLSKQRWLTLLIFGLLLPWLGMIALDFHHLQHETQLLSKISAP